MKNIVERAQQLMKAVERLEEKRDDYLYMLRGRAVRHAIACDPKNTKYLKYRVPCEIEKITVTDNRVVLSGTRPSQAGDNSETWTLPLEMANASNEEFDRLVNEKRVKSEYEEQQRQIEAERRLKSEESRELAELERLQKKYGKN